MARSRSPLGVIFVLVVVVLVAGGAGAYFFSRLGARGGQGTPASQSVVARDGARALVYSGGVATPFVLRGVERTANTLADRWRWTGASDVSAYPWEWARRGDWFAGAFHLVHGVGPERLELFELARGHVGTIENLERGVFGFADDHTALASSGGQLRLVDLAHPDAPAWSAPLTPSPSVTWIAATPAHAVAWNGALQVFDRAHAGPPRIVGPVTDVLGVAAERDEVLALRNGQLVVFSLNDGAERATVDLGGGQAVTDGLDDPCLLGRFGDRWLVLYATTVDQVYSNPQAQYSIPSAKFLAAVDPATGTVAWRTPLGRWRLRCNEDPFRYTLATDAELSSPVLLHGVASVENGGGEDRGHFAAIDAATGALQWESTYERATRSASFFVRHGAVVYARVGTPNDEAVVRFEGARLTGAVRVGGTTELLTAASTAPEGAWIGGRAWAFLAAPDLRVAGRGGDPVSITEARAWAVTRFALPPAAR